MIVSADDFEEYMDVVKHILLDNTNIINSFSSQWYRNQVRAALAMVESVEDRDFLTLKYSEYL